MALNMGALDKGEPERAEFPASTIKKMLLNVQKSNCKTVKMTSYLSLPGETLLGRHGDVAVGRGLAYLLHEHEVGLRRSRNGRHDPGGPGGQLGPC